MRFAAVPVLLLLLASSFHAAAGLVAPAPGPARLVERVDAAWFEAATILDPSAPIHLPAPATATGIGPGTRLVQVIPGAGTFGCTANFVWREGGRFLLGAAGHCFLPADRSATHGPGADHDASGVQTYACVAGCTFGGQTGFMVPGTLRELGPVVYARQSGATGSDSANDFGLVEVPSDLVGRLRPGLPVWGGPTSARPAPALGPLCFYGNSMALGETFPTMARVGMGSNEFIRDEWSAFLPVTFGDSGAALVTCEPDGAGLHGARPVGVVTHGVPGLAAGPTVDRARTLAAQAGLSISLVTG